jgi:hypothetical protein
LVSQDAEKQLKYLRQINANRQKLMKTELEFKLLEEDPNASAISNAAYGRVHFPHGASPLAQPSSERDLSSLQLCSKIHSDLHVASTGKRNRFKKPR